jgi:hypothetical protein
MPHTTERHFRSVAPAHMRLLLTDFPELGVEDAAAVFGNAGHESRGLTDDQEDKPVVKGSHGGLNGMQWTGPRRRAMEAYCARNKLDAASDIAAYKWLFLELKGAEKKAIPALLKATTLEQKVVAFEKAFLRAGIKHYPSRQQWARVAMAAYADHAGDGAEAQLTPRGQGTARHPSPIAKGGTNAHDGSERSQGDRPSPRGARARQPCAQGFTDEQIAQIRAVFREELADAGLRLDDATHQDEAREGSASCAGCASSWDGAVNEVGNAVLLALIAVGGTIVGLGFWAWLAGSLQR